MKPKNEKLAQCYDCKVEFKQTRRNDWFVCPSCKERFHVDEICENCSHNFVYRQTDVDVYERTCKCGFIEEV